MFFEWDEAKNEINIRKHGIDFNDVPDIFQHPMLALRDDRENYGEERWISIGWIKVLIGVVVVVSLIGVAWTLWERQQHDPWLRTLARVRRRLAAQGIEAGEHATPRELARVASAQLGDELFTQQLSAWLLRLPWLGPLARGVNTARFASTLAILVRGGVPLLAAMESGARVMDNVVMREAVTRAMDRVREGASLARALDETRLFPALLVHLVASGETSGRLEQMLERAAQLETRALERRLAVFLTLLEPLMILLMGGVVLMIVLAILLPIMEINQLVQ